MPFNLENECRIHGVNKLLTEQIDSRLFPLLERATDIDLTLNMFLEQKQVEDEKTILSNFKVFENLLVEIKNELTLEPKEIAVLFLLDYLIIVESLFTDIVDIISYALISTGKVLTDPRSCREVITFEEIRILPLGMKLDFIRSNGFSMISDRCLVKLRNSAAHLSYALDENGNITLQQGDFIRIFDDMNELQDKLRDAAVGGHIALRHFYYEKYVK